MHTRTAAPAYHLVILEALWVLSRQDGLDVTDGEDEVGLREHALQQRHTEMDMILHRMHAVLATHTLGFVGGGAVPDNSRQLCVLSS